MAIFVLTTTTTTTTRPITLPLAHARGVITLYEGIDNVHFIVITGMGSLGVELNTAL